MWTQRLFPIAEDLPPQSALDPVSRTREMAAPDGEARDVRFSLDPVEGEQEQSLLQTTPSSAPPQSVSLQMNSECRRTRFYSAPTILHLDSFNSDSISPKFSRKVRQYYRKQSDLLNSFQSDTQLVQQVEKQKSASPAPTAVDNMETLQNRQETVESRAAQLLAKVSLAVNVVLLVVKLTAVILSGSFSIISSLVDSAVDITSGVVIWLTTRAIKNRDPYLYPRGRTRLEPLALVIISVVMAVASVQMIVQSAEAMLRGDLNPDVGLATVLIMVFTIISKLVLAILCHFYRDSPSIRVLAQDHRNDCVSNTVAILCAYLAAHFWVYLDPIGAILVSLYIAVTWFYTGYGQIVILSGRSAKPSYINRILKICLEHDARIIQIDTVFVYHFGTRFLVEVHIVLDPKMTLMEAHDISEPLQCKIEHLPWVERAFVHVDYDSKHRPEEEHKIV